MFIDEKDEEEFLLLRLRPFFLPLERDDDKSSSGGFRHRLRRGVPEDFHRRPGSNADYSRHKRDFKEENHHRGVLREPRSMVRRRGDELPSRYPEKVTTRLRELLGKSARSDLVLDYKGKYKLPFEIRENEENGRSTVEVFIDIENGGKGSDDDGDDNYSSHTIEELVATTLQYAMKIGTALGKGAIKDAVVSVPPYFSQTQRRALYDAADIAGLNVMALVSDVSCAALQWGIDKDFAKNETRNVIFYDVGSSPLVGEFSRIRRLERTKVEEDVRVRSS